MSHPNNPKHDELRDRLMDQALRETLGGEAPPDLSGIILAAVEEQSHVSTVSSQRKERVMDTSKRGAGLRLAIVAAVCVVIGVSIALLLPGAQSAREAARRDSDLQGGPSSDYMNDDVEYGEGDEFEFLEAPAAEPALEGKVSEPYSAPSTLPQPAEPGPPIQTATEAVELHEFGSAAAPRSDLLSTVGDYQGAALAGRGQKPLRIQAGGTVRQDGYWSRTTEGQGPGRGGDRYDSLVENAFRAVKDHPLSTFSIDVDTASYANVRRFLLQENRLPSADAVRIEELINYFDYDYAGPDDERPFAARIEVAGCPWAADHRLVRVGLKGKEFPSEQRPASNLVFLLDVSGSMNSPDKLPLLKAGMKMLARQLGRNDRVAIVVYAGSEGLVLPSTPGSDQQTILGALNRLRSGGSTNGGAGIELAYRIAQENLIEDGVNRVILCTDGDFNVGTTSTGALVRMVEERAGAGVFLSVLGFGRGNLNDAMMENISNKGNGNYAYIDGVTEAQKVLVEQMGGTLVTIAKDVKIQIECNPAQVAAYRLIGYENRILAAEDFNDDKKDAGEIGPGHTVTALYELVPAGMNVDTPTVDPLKYQKPAREKQNEDVSNELLTLKLRYKAPDGDKSKLLEFPVVDGGARFAEADSDMQFAAAVAAFGMLLRGSEHAGTATYDAVLEIAASAQGPDLHGYRTEFLEMIRRAKGLAGG